MTTKETLKKKAVIEYEGKTYWLDMTDGFPTVKTMNDDGKSCHSTLKTEVDLFDLMEMGHVISNEEPSWLSNVVA